MMKKHYGKKFASIFVAIVLINTNASALTLTGKYKDLPSGTVNAIKSIAEKSGDQSLLISSANRDAKNQIRISLEAYGSAKNAKAIYGSPCKNAFNETTQVKMVAALTKIITDNPNRGCMRHINSGGKVIDIDPASVKDKKKFYEAVLSSSSVDHSRFYYPDIEGVPKSTVKDKAFHIEFK